jgi:hypothetical protein
MVAVSVGPLLLSLTSENAKLPLSMQISAANVEISIQAGSEGRISSLTTAISMLTTHPASTAQPLS